VLDQLGPTDGAALSAQREALLHPDRLTSGDEVLACPSPVPAAAGVYAWYFAQVPPGVPVRGCHSTSDGVFLYVGISAKAPPRGGGTPSRQTLRTYWVCPYSPELEPTVVNRICRSPICR
jgi:hypothetical protein